MTITKPAKLLEMLDLAQESDVLSIKYGETTDKMKYSYQQYIYKHKECKRDLNQALDSIFSHEYLMASESQEDLISKQMHSKDSYLSTQSS